MCCFRFTLRYVRSLSLLSFTFGCFRFTLRCFCFTLRCFRTLFVDFVHFALLSFQIMYMEHNLAGNAFYSRHPSPSPLGANGHINLASAGKNNKRPNEGPKESTEGSKGPNEGPKGSTKGSKGPNEGPKGSNEGSKRPNEGPKGSNEGSKGPNEGPEGPNEEPNGPNEGPEGPNKGPKGSNEGSKGPNEGPNAVKLVVASFADLFGYQPFGRDVQKWCIQRG
jgi:hypothetical protein